MILTQDDRKVVNEAKELGAQNMVKFLLVDPKGLPARCLVLIVQLVDIIEREASC